MVDRILQLLKHLGMSPSRFADEIGVQRSAMSHLVSGRNNPSLEFVSKVLKRFPEVDTEWLITGTGTITRDKEEIRTPVTETSVPAPPEKDLFPDIEAEPHVKEEPLKQLKLKKPADKTAERIIIVYNDRTFRELYPDKD
jgi:transcriptional regulator with XRE-family HTH domain